MKRSLKNRIDGKMKLKNRRMYHWVIGGVAAVVVISCLLIPAFRNRDIIFGALATVGGLGAFLFQQHVNEAQFFANLFEKFNERYDKMNGRLQRLLSSKTEFSKEDEHCVIDYFNLCAEEWLFYNAGYIDQLVWESWLAGMEEYGNDDRFAELWWDESEKNSYYGLEFPAQKKDGNGSSCKTPSSERELDGALS